MLELKMYFTILRMPCQEKRLKNIAFFLKRVYHIKNRHGENIMATGKDYLSPEVISALRNEFLNGVRCNELAEKYSISINSVYKICRNIRHYDPSYEPPKRGVIQKGKRNNNSKLTDEQVKQIREMGSNGVSLTSLAIAFGVHKSTVQRIMSGKIH